MKRWMRILLMVVVLAMTTTPVMGKEYIDSMTEISKVQVIMDEDCEAAGCTEGFLWQDTVYVPVRFVMEQIGTEVDWNASSKSVHITSKKQTKSLNITEKVEIAEVNVHDNGRKEAEILLLKIDSAIDQLVLFNDLLELAYDMYETSGETNWIQQVSRGKVVELINGMNELSQEIIVYQERNLKKNDQTQRYTQLAKKLVDSASYYEQSSQALTRYADNKSSGEKKTFLLYRYFALEKINEISDDTLKLHLELEIR